MFRTSSFLRRVLLIDASSCIASGLLSVFGSRALGRALGLPDDLLLYAGLSLFPFAAFLIYLAVSKAFSRATVWAAILLNALWVLDSFLLLLTGWVTPTEFGYVFVVAQALGVAMLATLEYVGLRKSEAASLSS